MLPVSFYFLVGSDQISHSSIKYILPHQKVYHKNNFLRPLLDRKDVFYFLLPGKSRGEEKAVPPEIDSARVSMMKE